ncbi:MAG: hypothetical protein FWD91_04425 [Treponema sp.]|nr:hypothetical protein [Treponema sp.]
MSEVRCPKCGRTDKQNRKGFTTVGSQALQLLMLGNSGRAVGKALGMSKSNVYLWAIEEGKKIPRHLDKPPD